MHACRRRPECRGSSRAAPVELEGHRHRRMRWTFPTLARSGQGTKKTRCARAADGGTGTVQTALAVVCRRLSKGLRCRSSKKRSTHSVSKHLSDALDYSLGTIAFCRLLGRRLRCRREFRFFSFDLRARAAQGAAPNSSLTQLNQRAPGHCPLALPTYLPRAERLSLPE